MLRHHPFKINSVRLRLTLWNVGVLALVLLIFGSAVRYALQMSLRASTTSRLQHQASVLTQAALNPPPFGVGLSPMYLPPNRRAADQTHVYRGCVISATGRPLTPFSPAQPWDPRTFALALAGQDHYSFVHSGTDTLCVFSEPLRRGDTIVGGVQAVTAITEDIRQVDRLTRILLTLTPLALLAAGGGGAFLTGRALRPIREISQAASRIGASTMSGRLPVVGDDELADLAATFNAMLGRLEDAFKQLTEASDRQRRFTADASHELRTPLTVIKANTSLALLAPRTAAEYQTALEAVDRAADRTERIVHDLLLQARIDAGRLALRQEALSLRELAEAAREAYVPPVSATVTITVPQTLQIFGDGDALLRLLGNLLFNAVQHTPQDGSIAVDAAREGEMVAITVSDTGEGIAPEHLPHLGERFYRVDAARACAARTGRSSGTGLGLAICRGIAEAHGGSLSIASTLGVGTTVTISLPSAMPDDENATWQEREAVGVG